MASLKAGLLAALALAAFAGSARAADTSPILLGMVVGTSGQFAGGEAPLVNGVKMAVDDLNAKGGIGGRPVKLVIEDTGSEQTGAMNAFNRMTSQTPVAIMDTTLTGFVMTQMAAIDDAGIPVFTGGAGAILGRKAKGVGNLFRIRTSDTAVPVAAIRYAIETLHASKVGLLRVNSDYGLGWKTAIEAYLGTQKMSLVGIETCDNADKDLTPQLLRLKNAGAEVVIHAGDPPTQVLVMQERTQLALPYQLISSNSGVLPTTLRVVPQDASAGVFGTVDSVPAQREGGKDWAAAYQARFNVPSDYSSAEYYDGVMMLAQAIGQVGTEPEKLVKALNGISAYRGLGNTYNYTATGDGGAEVAIVKVDKGQAVLVQTVR